MNIEGFNALSATEMRERLIACCHCDAWADRVVAKVPFETAQSLAVACQTAWQTATEAEILEAFSGHPQIGDLEALKSKYAPSANVEQGQVSGAHDATLVRLRDRNREYLEKFGFIFIVCASGKTAEEMLTLLEARSDNARETELGNGAREQGAITELRLARLFEE